MRQNEERKKKYWMEHEADREKIEQEKTEACSEKRERLFWRWHVLLSFFVLWQNNHGTHLITSGLIEKHEFP